MIIKANGPNKVKNLRGGTGEGSVISLLDQYNLHGVSLLSIINLEPHSNIGLHQHSGEGEGYFIIEGNATFNDNGTLKKVSSGDFCVILPGESHGLTNVTNKPLKILAVVYENITVK